MRKLAVAFLVVVVALSVVVGVQAFGGKHHVKGDELTGYQEATPAGVSTTGSGTFSATIDDAAQTIDYSVTYQDLEADATQSHIHFGNRYDSGGVTVFLCSNLGNGPAGTPPCPLRAGTVSGTWTPASVTGGAASQGIAAGEFDELVRAIRAGVTYVNVHSTKFPAGEIRAQVNDPDQKQVN